MSELLKKLTPTWIVTSVKDIEPDALKAHGIEAVITDLDNTLVPWRRYDIPPDVIEWLARLKAADIKLCIASNTIRVNRLKKIAGILGIPFVEGVRKPSVDGFVRSMKLMGSTRENTAVFGDQLFTDILAGNRLGLKTILLFPPLSTKDLITTAQVRKLERLVRRSQESRGAWPEAGPLTADALRTDTSAERAPERRPDPRIAVASVTAIAVIVIALILRRKP